MKPQKLTVVTFKWQGWRALYDHRHVNALGRMLERTMSIPYRFVCVTDDPTGIEYDTMELWDEPLVRDNPCEQNCYRRLKLFDPDMRDVFGGGYVLQLDLDAVIVQDLAPVITWEAFRILHGARTPYNGSMWLHQLGTRPYVWREFDPETSPRRALSTPLARRRRWQGSDQVWISYRIPGEPTWTMYDGIYRFEGYFDRMRRGKPFPTNCRAVFFPGPYKKKPWSEFVEQSNPDVFTYYMRHFDA